ncbi:BofC C-terminal domain-containing protein [Acetonema longum]|uniref:Bypass of forespore C C-terminal domain-containing protein n=1 Tax=Acetonema longum DSM 6540 TaxID=1009370 RepID=F7NQ86_9FIRM|nr:BofC C-terminal domain-containing protein [Acetonema longum]EGO61845.1 hypothetical protein ALO_21434 [Acetonema longum DSM 6540]
MFHPKMPYRFVWLFGILLIVGLLAYFYLPGLSFSDGSSVKEMETELVKQDASVKIFPQTDIYQRIVYSKCGDEESSRTKPADSLIGMNLLQFQKVYTGWNIDHFDASEVRMTLTIDSMCREHANNIFIGQKDGYVTVFYGLPGRKPIVKEVTKIPVNHLTQDDVAELQRGIVVQSKEDMLKTLEGMQSR